jgi:hypothetical protein
MANHYVNRQIYEKLPSQSYFLTRSHKFQKNHTLGFKPMVSLGPSLVKHEPIVSQSYNFNELSHFLEDRKYGVDFLYIFT